MRRPQKGNFKIKKLSAFTLVEMIVVVVLIVLVTGIFGGIYSGTYKRLRVKEAAKNFFLAAKYARLTAIEGQQKCRMMLDTANNKFELASEVLDEESQQAELVAIRNMYSKVVKLPDGISFEKVLIEPLGYEDSEGQGDSIVFLSDGTSQSAIIQFGDGENHYTVNICAATARAQIREGEVNEIGIGVIDLDRK